MWWFFLPAAAALGTAGAILAFRGSKILVYQSSIGDAAQLARDYFPDDWEKYPVQTGSQILQIARSRPRISRFIIIAHAGPDWVLDRSLSPEVLGAALGPRLTWGSVTGFAGCSAARSPSEPALWSSPHIYRAGGADSYAGRYRDAARAAGAPLWSEALGHTIYGHTLGSPAGRICSFAKIGSPCRSVKPAGVSDSTWVDQFQGVPAAMWISGQD